MIVQINDQYINTDSVEYITDINENHDRSGYWFEIRFKSTLSRQYLFTFADYKYNCLCTAFLQDINHLRNQLALVCNKNRPVDDLNELINIHDS